MADQHDKVIELRAKNPNRRKDYWQESEKTLLKEMYLSGYGITELALRFDRSELAIFNQILNMDIIPRSRNTREKKTGCRCPGCTEYGNCDKLSCRGDGTDLLDYGQVVTAGFFCQSPLDNARERLTLLSQREKRFELDLLRRSFELALRPVPKEEQISLPAPEGAEQPIGKEEALAQAEEIFRQLRDRAVASPSGEVGWYMQEGDEGRFTYARPKLFPGTAGLGVFFAGVYRASASAHLKSQARGLCQVVLDQLCRHLESLEKARKIPESILPLGLSDGAAGILKSLVMMGRCLGAEVAGPAFRRLMPLLEKIRFAEYSQLDVISGAAGLIQVLCGYEELRTHPLTPGIVKACAGKLLEAKTLETDSGQLLWDTLHLGRPISGMGHGIAGLGVSLQMAGAFLHREDCLQAANDGMEPIYVRDVVIQGVARFIIKVL